MDPFDILQAKTAVITGSGRGIGRAIALELGRHGANIAVNYFRHPEAAEGTAAEVRQAGGRAFTVKAHVAMQRESETMLFNGRNHRCFLA